MDIDHFSQRDPQPCPARRSPGRAKFDDSDESAVVYAKQWNNPRPGTGIKSVDLVYGEDKDRGVPVLLAVTAANAR